MKFLEKLWWVVCSLVFVLFVRTTRAQVLITGQTSGRGNGAVFLSGNGTLTNDGVGITNNWVGANLGLTNRIDLSLGGGDLTLLGHHFPYILAGGVFALPTRRAHVDVSVYQAVIAPVSNRRIAGTIVNSAIVVSKTFAAKKLTFTPYTGVSWLYSLGPRDRILSVSKRIFQVPLGISIPLGGKWGLVLEYDHGHTRSIGMAVSYSFQLRK